MSHQDQESTSMESDQLGAQHEGRLSDFSEAVELLAELGQASIDDVDDDLGVTIERPRSACRFGRVFAHRFQR